MSSFTDPHFMYLFTLKSGKLKLAYGQNPQDALEILSFRLTPEEMSEIIPESCQRISPREIDRYADLIG